MQRRLLKSLAPRGTRLEHQRRTTERSSPCTDSGLRVDVSVRSFVRSFCSLCRANKIDRVHYSREITLVAQRSAEKLPWDASPPSAALLASPPTLRAVAPSTTLYTLPPPRDLWLPLPRPSPTSSTPTRRCLSAASRFCVIRARVYATLSRKPLLRDAARALVPCVHFPFPPPLSPPTALL